MPPDGTAEVRVALDRLAAVPALERPDLLAPPVVAALRAWPAAATVRVAVIDPELADTAAFCAHYGVAPDESANCVVVTGRRGGEERLAGCVILATTRADVNGLVRRTLDVRKASFAAVEAATTATGMDYGGITPVGLPPDWPLLVDAAVTAAPEVVVGSGTRAAKLLLPGAVLAELPGAQVLAGLGR